MSFSSTVSPLPPRVVSIFHGIFKAPSDAGLSVTVPTSYELFVSESAPSNAQGRNGDWYMYNTATSIRVYQKKIGVWTLITTLSGGGTGGSGGGGPPSWPNGNPLDDPQLGPILNDIINEHNNAVAQILQEVADREAAILAEHNAWVDALLQEVSDRNAAIVTATNIIDSNVNALAAQITVVTATINDPDTGLAKAHARVTEESLARASAVSAEAARITTLESQVNTPTTGILARITTVENTLTSGQDNTALAFRVTTLEAQVQDANSGLLARVQSIETAYVDSASATAIARDEISASIQSSDAGTIGARVLQEASARATETGNLSGQYVLKVVAGNRVTGMRITSVSSPAAGDTSEIVFDTAAFKIYNGSTGVAPFQTVNGQVRITGSLVLSTGDISGLGTLATQNSVAYTDVTGTKPPANADVTLSAIQGQLSINSGGLVLSGTAAVRSSDYVAGTAGWAMLPSGIDVKAGTFRGVVDIEGASGNAMNRTVINGAGLAVGPYLTINGTSNQTTIGISGVTYTARITGGVGGSAFMLMPGLPTETSLNDAGVLKLGGVTAWSRSGSEIQTNVKVTINNDLYVSGSASGSARRFKKNIRPIENALESVKRLNGKVFDWRTKSVVDDIGFIADEVYDVFPSIVMLDHDGEPLGIDYGKLTAVLAEAIKELEKKVNGAVR